MAMHVDPTKVREFEDEQSFYEWLRAHAATQDELWIKIHKVSSGLRSITPKEAIDACLCWGWIDGIRKGFDDRSFLQRYCAIAGEGQVPTCAAQARSPMHRLVLGALDLATAEPPHYDAIDAFARGIDDTEQAGSMGMQMEWFGTAVGAAVSASNTSDTCIAVTEWSSGAGLAPHAVDGTAFVLDLPTGTVSRNGIAAGPSLLSLGLGTSTHALDAITNAMPASCQPLAEESRDGFRVFDCAGQDLVSQNREIWAITDLGDLRAFATARVRHQSARWVASAMATRLRTLRRAAPAAPIDLARWGLRGTTDGWPNVVTDHASHVVLTDALPPSLAARWLWFITAPDTSLCRRARDRNAAAPASRVVVLDDATLDGDGCEIATWNPPEPPGGGSLVVLRVEATAEGATIAQYYAPLADEPAARAAMPTAHAAIDRALRAPAAATTPGRRAPRSR